MQPGFTRKLDLHVWKTKIGTQKIDNSRFKTFGIIIASFLVDDKDKKS